MGKLTNKLFHSDRDLGILDRSFYLISKIARDEVGRGPWESHFVCEFYPQSRLILKARLQFKLKQPTGLGNRKIVLEDERRGMNVIYT